MSRKLQSEIERTLKKIQEGLEIFDSTFEKLPSFNQSQREKYEQELKKEIKKLQRLRETVRGWIANPEIKEKKTLQDYRRKVEEVFCKL
jgi:CCR4-NOT transcription complex subunit 3